MEKLMIADEKEMIASMIGLALKQYRIPLTDVGYDRFYFVADDHFLCDYLMCALPHLKRKVPQFGNTFYVTDGGESAYRAGSIAESEIKVIGSADFSVAKAPRSAVFFFADCSENVALSALDEKRMASLRAFLKQNPDAHCIATMILPKIAPYGGTAQALAERELDYYLENKSEKTPALQKYLALYGECKKAVRDDGANVTLLRFDNVFAPDRFSTPSLPLEQTIREALQKNVVTITDEDRALVSSITSVREAGFRVFRALVYGKKGHVYNGSAVRTNLAVMKEAVYSSLPDRFSLEKKLGPGVKPEYNALSALKFRKLAKPISDTSTEPAADFLTADFADAVRHSVCCIGDEKFDTSANIAFYDGKLGRIQQLEMVVLAEIDRICRENDIHYFLAGGSLLGAVRSGGAIPWDDDLDIGMLRGDYEKFRKVCESSLGAEFVYSSPFNHSGSHYTLDKVRLKGTWFATNYSSLHAIDDGIFVDILIYDKTSNNKFLRNFQILMLSVLYDCIILRWRGVPLTGRHHRLSLILLPLVKIFSFGFYHRLFEHFVQKYKNKKDAIYLIDSVGKKLKDGPLQNKGLDEVVYVDFDGVKAPIPVDPAPYLTYAYGPNYMQKPVPSMRKGPHNFARIDLGGYLFGDNTAFRKGSLKGELYEADAEQAAE